VNQAEALPRAEAHPGRLRRALRWMWKWKTFTLGLFLVGLFVVAALGANLITHYDPVKTSYAERLQPPGSAHLFGTDEHGRDLFTRVVFGARISLVSSALAVGISAGVGIMLGLTTGFFGGLYDGIVSRVLDAFFGFPVILMAIAIVAIVGPSVEAAMIAIGIIGIPGFARVSRAAILTERENEYVEASRANASHWGYIIFRSILPNCMGPILVLLSLGFARAVLNEAALSFLGMGAQPPDPSWGSMLSTGRRYLADAPWYSLFPGGAIFLLVLSLNLIGDGLQDLADPRRTNR
jgi:peptide/nickel transport system permease protein